MCRKRVICVKVTGYASRMVVSKVLEASVVIQPGVGEREVMVCVDNWMWVPLLRVQPGEYEVISLAEEGKHVYPFGQFPDTKMVFMRRWAVIGGWWRYGYRS